jgi:Uma2 family endonuclease
MTLLTKKLYTPLEYLKLEETAEVKHEYHQGIVTEMAGGASDHNIVVGNVFATAHQRVKHIPCIVYPSDMRVQVKESSMYTYPDVTLVCGEPEFAKGRNDTLLNPTVIAEVLSPKTRAYDRGKKFDLYRPLKSLQGYILIDPDQPYVDYFQREADRTWQLFEHRRLTDKLQLQTPKISIRLADLYDKVDWLRERATTAKKRKK